MDNKIDSTCKVQVIAVSPFESDHIALAHIFGHTAWRLDSARSLREASVLLFAPRGNAVPPVILCDETLYDGSWQDLLRMTQGLPCPANLIVTTNRADDRLWAEVLNLGAYDVLQKPFRSQEVFRTVGLAWTDLRKTPARKVSNQPTVVAGAVA
jgi:FixJ family two-component response regulator